MEEEQDFGIKISVKEIILKVAISTDYYIIQNVLKDFIILVVVYAHLIVQKVLLILVFHSKKNLMEEVLEKFYNVKVIIHSKVVYAI